MYEVVGGDGGGRVGGWEVFGLELLQRTEEENPTLSYCRGSYIYLSSLLMNTRKS